MVVAPVVVLAQCALRVNRPAKFAAANHERVLEHAALLEVFHKRSGGLIDILALVTNIARAVAVLIPAAVEQLHKRHAALEHAPREDAVVGILARLLGVLAVQVEDVIRLGLEIGQLRHAGLHTKRHFVLGNARLDFRVARRSELGLIHGLDAVEDRPA